MIIIEKNNKIADQIQGVNTDFENFKSLSLNNDLAKKYGITEKSLGYGQYVRTYNGQSYSHKETDKLKAAIIADLEALKEELPKIPAEVTVDDVSAVRNEAAKAAGDLQKELDVHVVIIQPVK